MRSRSPISRTTRAGTPATTTPEGRSRVTTAPAPTTVCPPTSRRADRDASAEPDVVPEDNRLAGLPPYAPRFGVDRMSRSKELNTRRDLARGSDRDRRDVEHEAVVVEERPIADRDPRAVLAAERRADVDSLPDVTEELPEDLVSLVLFRVKRRVVAVEESLGTRKVSCQVVVVRDVQVATEHPVLHLAQRDSCLPGVRRTDTTQS